MQNFPERKRNSNQQRHRVFVTITLLALLVLPLTITHPATTAATGTAPLATYQATGPPVQMYYQIINNTSFETGTQSWTELFYNNFTRAIANTTSPGYNDNSAAQLTLNSGNLTTDSHLTLLQDFSQSSVGFANGLRLRAVGQVRMLTGISITDRVEVSIALAGSNGNLARIHYVLSYAINSAIPANSTSDAYIATQGLGSPWIILDRNVTSDAASAFPTISGTLSTVRDARLSVFSTSLGAPTDDPRIKYWETGTDSYWNTTETVVFDPDADGFFNPATDWILYNQGVPSTNQPLRNDLRIKFVDNNQNGHWDAGEPIVYDLKNEGVYDLAANDPVINGTAVAGSLLQYPIRQETSALFDQVELYSPTGNINWAHNGGFETGDLAGWGNIAGFKVVTSPTHSGSYSANGTSTGTPAALAQGTDSRPAIDTTTRLQASGYVGKLTGTTFTDKADIWLGLVDSSPQATPLSVYYYFKTGTGTLPSNTTDTVNHKVPSYGTVAKWLNLTQNLLPETSYFDSTGHTGPYRIEAAVLEVSAQTGQTTTAIFDDISIPTSNHPTYYAFNSINSTYVYNTNKPPQGTFYFSVPGQQSVLNITTANGTPVQTSEYATQTIQGSLQITVPTATVVKYPALGNWHVYTTSKNALARLQAATSGSTNSSSSFNTGATIDFASQTRDPAGIPITGSNVTMIFSAGNTLFSGKTNSQGWFNQTSVVLPSSPGTLTLEAISASSSYIGLRIITLTINSPTPWALIAYISIAAAAAVLFSLFLFMRRRKSGATSTKSAIQPGKSPNTQQTRPRKGK